MRAAPLGSRYLSLRLARRMRHAQHAYERLPADAPGLTLDGLLNLHGQSGIPTLLMLFALFCIVPVGGVGNVFGVALWMLSWDVWQGRSDMRLPNRLASFRLNRRWSIHMLHGLGSGYRQASRWLRPRWPAMQAPWTRGPWALWIALQALIIFFARATGQHPARLQPDSTGAGPDHQRRNAAVGLAAAGRTGHPVHVVAGRHHLEPGASHLGLAGGRLKVNHGLGASAGAGAGRCFGQHDL